MRGSAPSGKGNLPEGTKEASVGRSPREGSAMPISGPGPRRGAGRSGRPERRDGRSRRPFRDAKRTGDSMLAAPPCQTAIREAEMGAGGRACRGRSPPSRRGPRAGGRSPPGGPARPRAAVAAWPSGTGASPTERGRKRGPGLSRGERPPRAVPHCRSSARPPPCPGGAAPAGIPGAGADPEAEPTRRPRARPTGPASSRRGRPRRRRSGGPGWRPAGRPHPPAGRTSGAPGARFPRGPAGP